MTKENQNQSVPNHGKVEEGSGLDVFMKNKALYLEFKVTHEDLTKEKMKEATIYFKHIRRNIDRAMTTKILIAHKMFIEFNRQKYVRQAEVHQHCQEFFKDYRIMCGKDYFEFDIFLRHFPDTFQIYRDKVLLRDIDMKELRKRYRAIILRPQALFNQGKLPEGYVSPFNVTLIERADYGDRIAKYIYNKHTRVGLDIKGQFLGPNGLISLCSVSVSSEHVYVFDISKSPYFLEKSFLRKILEAENITKVVFDIEDTASNLYREFNINLENVYDAQVAFMGLEKIYKRLRYNYQEKDDPNLEKKKSRVTRNFLMALYHFDTNNIQGMMDILYAKNPAFWHYRPLCEVLLHYAGEDVYALMGIQDAMRNCSVFMPDEAKTYHQTKRLIQDTYKASRRIIGEWKMPDGPIPRSVIRHASVFYPSSEEESVEDHPIVETILIGSSDEDPTSHMNRSRRDESYNTYHKSYLIGRELSSQKPNSTTLSYPFQYRDSPYINNPVTHPYIHNPVSSMESSCVLLLTIGFFCIILFKWYTFWKNRASLIQQKKWQDGLLRTIEENHESSNAT